MSHLVEDLCVAVLKQFRSLSPAAAPTMGAVSKAESWVLLSHDGVIADDGLCFVATQHRKGTVG